MHNACGLKVHTCVRMGLRILWLRMEKIRVIMYVESIMYAGSERARSEEEGPKEKKKKQKKKGGGFWGGFGFFLWGGGRRGGMEGRSVWWEFRVLLALCMHTLQ